MSSRINRVWSTVVENCQLNRYRCKQNTEPKCSAWVWRYGGDYQFECPELMCHSNVIFIWCRALIDRWSYSKFCHQFVCFCINYIHYGCAACGLGNADVHQKCDHSTLLNYPNRKRYIACHHHHQPSLCDVWNVDATFNKPQRNKIASNFHVECDASDFMAWHFYASELVSERTTDMAAHKL